MSDWKKIYNTKSDLKHIHKNPVLIAKLCDLI